MTKIIYCGYILASKFFYCCVIGYFMDVDYELNGTDSGINLDFKW